MRKRKLVIAVLAAGLGTGLLPAAHAQDAPADPAAENGSFTTPFREDGAVYDPTTNTFVQSESHPRGDAGCLPADEHGHRDCLPAGASQNVLADGRILYWNAIEGTEDLDEPDEAIVPKGGDLLRNDRSRVLTLDWAAGTGADWYTPENATGDFDTPGEPPLIPNASNDNSNDHIQSDGSLFCSDQKQLPNGRILAAGGTNYYAEPRLDSESGVIELEGVRNARIFDPALNNWTQTGHLNHGRWYPSMVTLSDGDVFIASGVTKLMKPLYPSKDPSRSGDNVPETETYDVATGTWTDNGESGQRSLPLFPRLHLLPNGDVYYDAAGQAFNPMGQSYKQALWNIAATYSPASKSWTDLGVPGLGAPTPGGPVAEPGFRGSTFSQALTYRANEDGDYTSGSFLTAGGVTLMSPGSYLPTDTTRINTVDVAGAAPALTTTPAGPLGRPRWYSSAVTLPTGQVLAFSGADVDEVISPGHEQPIRQAEMFTPEVDGDGTYTGGSWQDVAVAQRKRTYHNNAVLLPDGRVLIGGHAPIPHSYYQPRNNPDLPVREASNNFKDASFEIYSPPYLHKGVERPVIGNSSPAVHYGQRLIVPTADAEDIESVVLVRNPAETHLIDGDQRVVELPIMRDDSTGNAVQVKVTDNAAVLPPGPYMLFINKRSGDDLVPSVAKQVFVGTPVPGWANDASTYPEADEDVADDDAPAADSGPAAVAVSAGPAGPGAVAAEVGTALAAAPAASVTDRPRRTGLPAMALALGGAFVVGMSLMGTRRRRAVTINE
jgi:hypothetical protein